MVKNETVIKFPKYTSPAILLFSKSICIHCLGARNLLGFKKYLFFSPVIFLVSMSVIISPSLAYKTRKNLESLQHIRFKEVLGALTTSSVLPPGSTSSEGRTQGEVRKSELCQAPQATLSLRCWSPSLLFTCWLSSIISQVGDEAKPHGTSSYCSVKEVCCCCFKITV